MPRNSLLGATREPPPAQLSKRALTLTMCLAAATLFAPTAFAVPGRYASVDLVTRADGQVLPAYAKDGRHWVIGTPGREYSIRVCNTTGGRVLAVMSVDGVNVVTGDTASPAQSGYVLGAWECADIGGWRKSLSRTAAVAGSSARRGRSTRCASATRPAVGCSR